MAILHTRMKALSRSTGNTVRRLAYRAGIKLICKLTGKTFDYGHKKVQHVELLLPVDPPVWAHNMKTLIDKDRQAGIQEFSDLAESYEKRKDSQVYREYEFSLPRELNDQQCQELAREFAQDQLCGRGMVTLLNIHMDID